MNIKQAKDQIRNAMKAYFTKDSRGSYVIPIEKQRPIFLIGPPGVGKTAIMEQIAQEMNVGLLPYSMTHHTRQSALGLPFISKKTYDGREYDISEYTMSEIIASVYDMMEETGVREGILFLDEVNCVSETLAPVMLQFLQYKVFGRHRLPKGWIVVTAGNPPEYNNSVREFDIVTWDRLKRIDVDADYGVWKEYAVNKGVHPSITTYLDIKKDNFYRVETTADGKAFVTARGWEDLSQMIALYERHALKVDEMLVIQYLQHKRTAKDFAVYYDLFMKYRSDYQVDKILNGSESPEIIHRARAAKFDERLALLGLLLHGITSSAKIVSLEESVMAELVKVLREVKKEIMTQNKNAQASIGKQRKTLQAKLEAGKTSSSLSDRSEHELRNIMDALAEQMRMLEQEKPENGEYAFKLINADFEKRVNRLKEFVQAFGSNMDNMFRFAEKAFNEGQELLILVTELTLSTDCARFISRHGCERYFAHNKELLFYERQKELITRLEEIDVSSLSE